MASRLEDKSPYRQFKRAWTNYHEQKGKRSLTKDDLRKDNRTKSLLHNRNFILLMAGVLGLLLPQGSPLTETLTFPALSIVMTLSTMGVSGSVFRSPRSIIFPAILGNLMSYGVLAGFILGTSALIISEEDIWTGFILLASVPPAVAVIPFTEYLNGNTSYSLFGIIGAHLGALIIIPLIILRFLGTTLPDLGRVSIITLLFIVIPLFLSRLLIRKSIADKIEPIKGTVTNWSFFVVFYTVIGLNHDIFVQQPIRLGPVAVIAVASTFLLGLIIDLVGRLFQVDGKILTSLVLLGTIKNYGLAGGLALVLFSKQTAIPATVSTVFMFVYIVWLEFKSRRVG
jgi:bile acid:Na+ symporter, BASS family